MNNAVVSKNQQIAHGIYQIELKLPDMAAKSRPGQFVNFYTGDGSMLLPRPISICRINKEQGLMIFVYKVVGKGTDGFSRLKPGASLRVMGPLGNGFNIERGPVTLIGGGVGIPPLLEFAHVLRYEDFGRRITAYLGYKDKDNFLLPEFEQMCSKVFIATEDGSSGFHGTVVDFITQKTRGVLPQGTAYACGPKPMLNAVTKYARNSLDRLYLSLEERMACGTGACLGCAVMTKNGYKRICKDGPVFRADELEG